MAKAKEALSGDAVERPRKPHNYPRDRKRPGTAAERPAERPAPSEKPKKAKAEPATKEQMDSLLFVTRQMTLIAVEMMRAQNPNLPQEKAWDERLVSADCAVVAEHGQGAAKYASIVGLIGCWGSFLAWGRIPSHGVVSRGNIERLLPVNGQVVDPKEPLPAPAPFD